MPNIASTITILLQAISIANCLKTVHIVPHSHDDVGWVRTIDSFFNGPWNSVHDTI